MNSAVAAWGVVYLATDTRLDRAVAIKSLPVELATDWGRLERFEREAKTLAQLNHPNLAGIHGVEEQDGTRFRVLEYVEGETLADRLDRGPLPVMEAVEYAIQIATGIEAAHEAGVIHRDRFGIQPRRTHAERESGGAGRHPHGAVRRHAGG